MATERNVATSSAMASSSALAASSEHSGQPHAHITSLSASLIMKNIDRQAFSVPSTLDNSASSEYITRRHLRVADVDTRTAAERASSRRHGALSQDILYRERARQRRLERAQTRAQLLQSRKGKERDSGTWLHLQDDSMSKKNAKITYQPFSLPLLLERLASYSISTYSNKPDSHRLLSPLGMAMHGWFHERAQPRDEVICVTCKATWSARLSSTATRGENEEAYAALEQQVLAAHRPTCPWALKSCAPSLYRVPVTSRPLLQAELVAAASAFASCGGIEEVQLQSPISLPTQSTVGLGAADLPQSALHLAMFGWRLADKVSTASDGIASCPYCGRRAGLWAFLSAAKQPRHFDVVHEHKNYCPVINGEVQSGMWLESRALNGNRRQDAAPALPAWRLIVNIVSSENTGLAATAHQAGDLGTTGAVRSMKSADVLASVRGLVGGS